MVILTIFKDHYNKMNKFTNIKRLKEVVKSTLIKELISKTENCGLVWDQISPLHFRVEDGDYEFHLSKTSLSNYGLDVWKNGELYKSYYSYINLDIISLFKTIELVNLSHTYEEYRDIRSFLKNVKNCREQSTENEIIARGGATIGGASLTVNPANILLLPNSTILESTSSPWSGDYRDIDEATSDGNTSYMRQEVSGELPTNWGFVYAKFPLNNIPPQGPYRFNLRVDHRREINDGVFLEMALFVNSILVFSSIVESSQTYDLYASGVQPIPNITNIEDLQLRFNMFTNAGNLLTRALRVSAVNIRLFGYEES